MSQGVDAGTYVFYDSPNNLPLLTCLDYSKTRKPSPPETTEYDDQ
jgi:hypothetical protein